MPRPLRIDVPGLTHHVTNRGVQKRAIFHDDEDRQRFLRLLLSVRIQLPFVIQAYSLMTNHFHLLIKTLGETSLAQIMQYFTSRYATAFNRKYGHTGHAFQSRYHNIPVQTDAYLAEVSAYIDLNAPRAGLVMRPEDFAWCGYRSIILGRVDSIANPQDVLALFSDKEDRARILYQQFVNERLKKEEPLTQDKLLKKRSWGSLPLILGQKFGV